MRVLGVYISTAKGPRSAPVESVRLKDEPNVSRTTFVASKLAVFCAGVKSDCGIGGKRDAISNFFGEVEMEMEQAVDFDRLVGNDRTGTERKLLVFILQRILVTSYLRTISTFALPLYSLSCKASLQRYLSLASAYYLQIK